MKEITPSGWTDSQQQQEYQEAAVNLRKRFELLDALLKDEVTIISNGRYHIFKENTMIGVAKQSEVPESLYLSLGEDVVRVWHQYPAVESDIKKNAPAIFSTLVVPENDKSLTLLYYRVIEKIMTHFFSPRVLYSKQIAKVLQETS